jgi:hypothetical protein
MTSTASSGIYQQHILCKGLDAHEGLLNSQALRTCTLQEVSESLTGDVKSHIVHDAQFVRFMYCYAPIVRLVNGAVFDEGLHIVTSVMKVNGIGITYLQNDFA